MRKLVFALTVLWAANALSQDFYQVKTIESMTQDNKTILSVSLDRAPIKEEIRFEEHGTFLQMVIPNAQVLEPGKFYDGNSEYLKKVAAFQINQKDVGIRLFLSDSVGKYRDARQIDIKENRIILNFDHAKILTSTSEPVIEGVPSVSEVLAKTEVRNNVLDPVVEMNSASVGLFGSSFDAYKEYLDLLTVVAALGFLLVAIMFHLRKKGVRLAHKDSDPRKLAMKTLVNYPISPKQKLSVIEVGNQRLLIGVSPDNVSFLTELHAEKPQMAQTVEPLKLSHESNIRKEVPNVRPAPQTITGRKPELTRKSRVSPSDKLMDDSQAYKTQLNTKTKDIKPEPSTIEDVTKLIRRKLKDLPKI